MPNKKKPGYLLSTLACRCPRCREGRLFKNKVSISLKKNMAMPKTCAVCGQPTEKEPGFYYGTGYVSYAMGVAISVTTFIAWFVLIGMSVHDNRFFYWMTTNAVILIVSQPWLMRISRSIWISWFVKYDPAWKVHSLTTEDIERIIPEQQMN
jgi:uncharacterized protein (DUF983 family)